MNNLPQFVMVTGSPRSGTTAMRKWLGLHPQIAGFGESRNLVIHSAILEEVRRFQKLVGDLPFFAQNSQSQILQYYRNTGILNDQPVIVDKEPMEPIAFPLKNYEAFLNNVETIFPNTKFIYMIRSPLQTIWSMTQRHWGKCLVDFTPIYYSVEEHLENWCACADLLLKRLSNPNIMLCIFNELTDTPEDVSRKIYQFIGVEQGNSFIPRPVKVANFKEEEIILITERTQPYLKDLALRGYFIQP